LFHWGRDIIVSSYGTKKNSMSSSGELDCGMVGNNYLQSQMLFSGFKPINGKKSVSAAD
jgi:hypothetical protein